MRGSGPRPRSNPFEYCIYHRSYTHDMVDCKDIARHPRQVSPRYDQRNDLPQANKPPPKLDQQPRREEAALRQGDVTPIDGGSKMPKGPERVETA